jgi:hypothetical protein
MSALMRASAIMGLRWPITGRLTKPIFKGISLFLVLVSSGTLRLMKILEPDIGGSHQPFKNTTDLRIISDDALDMYK